MLYTVFPTLMMLPQRSYRARPLTGGGGGGGGEAVTRRMTYYYYYRHLPALRTGKKPPPAQESTNRVYDKYACNTLCIAIRCVYVYTHRALYWHSFSVWRFRIPFLRKRSTYTCADEKNAWKPEKYLRKKQKKKSPPNVDLPKSMYVYVYVFYTLGVIINNAAVSTTATAVKTMTRRTSSRTQYYIPACNIIIARVRWYCRSFIIYY